MTGEERRWIGEQVTALRSENGISQKDLAFKLGDYQERITHIEKGTLDYSIDALKVILDHFGRKIGFI